MSKKNIRFFIGAITALIVAFLAVAEVPQNASGELTLRALDVGQGDAFLFTFPGGEHMLVDAGPRKASKKLAKKLRAAGAGKIDIFVATHPHEDHIGGSLTVLQGFKVGKVWDSGFAHGSKLQHDMLSLIEKTGIQYGRPKAGFSQKIGDATIEVLAPRDDGNFSDANDSSLILRVIYGDVSFLMMGDAERKERLSVGHFPRSTIVKIAHHGSRNGTDDVFLNDTNPRVALISCGVGNSYGHPHREVIEALERRGVKSYVTTDGDIVVSTDGQDCEITQR